jgi:hypothetical protein
MRAVLYISPGSDFNVTLNYYHYSYCCCSCYYFIAFVVVLTNIQKKFIRMLKCNIATCKYFNADCVDVNSMRIYLIQIHCRREES